MPIYEYECGSCGRHFEKFVLSIQAANPKCPVCGADNVKKSVSPFATAGRGSVGGASSCIPSG